MEKSRRSGEKEEARQGFGRRGRFLVNKAKKKVLYSAHRLQTVVGVAGRTSDNCVSLCVEDVKNKLKKEKKKFEWSGVAECGWTSGADDVAGLFLTRHMMYFFC